MIVGQLLTLSEPQIFHLGKQEAVSVFASLPAPQYALASDGQGRFQKVPILLTLTQPPLTVSQQGLYHALLSKQWHQLRGWVCHLLSPGLHGVRAGCAYC